MVLPNHHCGANRHHKIGKFTTLVKKKVEQTSKALGLDDQQMFELATIKLNGPAQEWYYHQNDLIYNWTLFKQPK
ncbi:unnamed protein product [Rotaria socialis]|uniref:Uncharacterized protein n=2 Tax=Rotaria socialis TaxID=392032 RepID=A0A822BL33_9BILA|nr:unnamed protein product [Rotaria socialis]